MQTVRLSINLFCFCFFLFCLFINTQSAAKRARLYQRCSDTTPTTTTMNKYINQYVTHSTQPSVVHTNAGKQAFSYWHDIVFIWVKDYDQRFYGFQLLWFFDCCCFCFLIISAFITSIFVCARVSILVYLLFFYLDNFLIRPEEMGLLELRLTN